MADAFSTPERDVFPAGLRVLLVDNDATCLLKKMLTTCSYQVAECQRGEEALSALRKNKRGFDIIMADVEMPDMNGIQLVAEIANMRFDVPVILFSADSKPDIVKKGICVGACDFLLKPIQMSTIKIIWQHVVRRRLKLGLKRKTSDPVSSSVVIPVPSEKKKKPRISWAGDLKYMFISAVNEIGLEYASPRKILEFMQKRYKVTGLTRQAISSHLQIYRNSQRRWEPKLDLQGNSGWNSASVDCVAPPCLRLSQNHTSKTMDRATLGHQPAAAIATPTAAYISSLERIYPKEPQHGHLRNFPQSTIHPMDGVSNQHLSYSRPSYPSPWISPVFGSTFHVPLTTGTEDSSSFNCTVGAATPTEGESYLTTMMSGKHLGFQNSVDQDLGYAGCVDILMNEEGGANAGLADDDLFIEELIQNDAFCL